MKFKLFAMVLALSMVAWAQENPAASTPNATPAPETKSCCHHAAGAKDAKSCCHHATADAKDAAGCCGKDKCQMKDGKSCCAGMEIKGAKSCSGKDMKACMKQCKKNGGCKDGKCCGEAGEKSAMNCSGNGCERLQHAASGS